MDCSSCSGEGGWERSGMPGMLSRPERREESPSEEGGGESEPPRMDSGDHDDDVLVLILFDLLRWKILASDDAAHDNSAITRELDLMIIIIYLVDDKIVPNKRLFM
mmetsp:Transcript_26134/g.52538  ORF Transcript_26134/g.52538 Transcript_26134/m.52538 type:complete len:106 (+) Transcript_26134:872-1189(+)